MLWRELATEPACVARGGGGYQGDHWRVRGMRGMLLAFMPAPCLMSEEGPSASGPQAAHTIHKLFSTHSDPHSLYLCRSHSFWRDGGVQHTHCASYCVVHALWSTAKASSLLPFWCTQLNRVTVSSHLCTVCFFSRFLFWST